MQLAVHVMKLEPISPSHFINPSHKCVYVYPLTVARQRLGRYVSMTTDTHTNRRIVGGAVFCTVRVVSKQSLWVSLCVRISLFVKHIPRQRGIDGRVVFCKVRVVSEESLRVCVSVCR
jgi:hypothetical protein